MLVYSSQQRLEDLKTHSTGQGNGVTAPDIVGVDISDSKVLIPLLETKNCPKIELATNLDNDVLETQLAALCATRSTPRNTFTPFASLRPFPLMIPLEP